MSTPIKKIPLSHIEDIPTGESIGNKEYKISLSDLDVTGWEDPTFDDKVAEHIQTLNITVANDEIPYFIVEEPEPEPNFIVQADWGSLGVTDQTSFETWLNTSNDYGFSSEFGKYFIMDNIDDQNLSTSTYTISKFSLADDVVTCDITGNGNVFDLPKCNIQEVISLPNNLIYLDLRINQITSFDPTNDLSSLQYLNLDYNQITSFDPTNDLSSLQQLNLRSNKITSFDPTNDLSSLQRLNLRFNQLTSFNPTNDLSSLQRFDLRNNQITSFDPTNDLSSLQQLDLSNNQITSFDPTNDLSSLQYLELKTNQITSFDPTNDLSSLQYLDLSNNQISDWSQVTWIESIPNNGNAYLDGNPTSASSSPVHNALLAKSWSVSA